MSSNSNFPDNGEIVEIKNVSVEEREFKVMLELEGGGILKDRPGLDLVIVVDASASMGGQKMERMKTGLEFVIRELNLTDRLSVITSCGEGERLFPLRQINKSSQEEMEDVVNSLVARGGTNITAGLKMGLKLLNDQRLTQGRVAGLFLISDGYSDGDASLPPLGDLPVYTFGFGSHIDPTILKAIADASNGGTYSEVENLDDLSVAISQSIARLVTVVQDVKLTVTPLESINKVGLAGSYPQYPADVATGTVKVSFGDLYNNELRKVILNLFVSPLPLRDISSREKPPGSFTLTDMYVWWLICGSYVMALLKWLAALLDRTRKSEKLDRVEAIIKEKSLPFIKMVKNATVSANENMLYSATEKQKEATEEANTSNESTDPLKPLNQSLDSLTLHANKEKIASSDCRYLTRKLRSNSNFQDNGEMVEIKNVSEREIKVMLELKGGGIRKDRPGVDLVIVVDASANMGGQKMEKMKTGLQFVIRELNLTDRLSVITSCGEGERLFPLRQINKTSQEEIEDVVNSLVARGGTNIIAGMKMGLKMLNDRRLTQGRVAGLILISDGYSDGEPSFPPFGDLPVYTFGFGSHIDPTILKAIADASNGGTYTEIENLDDLSVAISQSLARLVAVVVQDVKLTITPLGSGNKVVLDGSYPQYTDDATGSVIVSFGDLYDNELRKVILNLFLSPLPLPGISSREKLPGSSTLTDMYVCLLICGSYLMAVLKWLAALLVRTRKSEKLERVEAIIQEKSLPFVKMVENATASANESMLYFAREKLEEATEEANSFYDSTDPPKALNQSSDSLTDELKKVN